MYQFFLNMWVFRTIEEIDETDIYKGVTNGRITEEEYQQIIATPKDE